MKKILLATLIFFVSLSISHASQVVETFKAEGATANVDWRDPVTEFSGQVSMIRMAFRDSYSFHFHVSQGLYPSTLPLLLASGGGYIPASAVSGNLSSGLRVQFDSSTLPDGDFSTKYNMPVVIDIKMSKRGDTYEKFTGSRITKNWRMTTRTHGMTESATAIIEGEIAGYPVSGDFYGQIGTNKNMTVQIKYDPETHFDPKAINLK